VNIKIQEIPLSEFDLSLSGMRIMNMDRILQIEKSMRLHGQLQPVVVQVHEGILTLIDGFKRLYAAEDLMMETLQCRLLEIDQIQAKVLLLNYNRSHQSMEAWEEAVILKDLLETHDLDHRRLARLTGYSPSWVSRRLALISKMDKGVSSDIMMGVLTSSHARALIRLPRGNQCKVARVITNYRLTSRQSDRLVDAFVEAEDETRQRYILTHPEKVLKKREPQAIREDYDPRLCSYGNDLEKSMRFVLRAVHILLTQLDDRRIGELDQTQKVILTPGFKKISGCAGKLTEAIAHLQIHKPIQKQDER
jgi:ParB/RepB/Spo0J family partition protein